MTASFHREGRFGPIKLTLQLVIKVPVPNQKMSLSRIVLLDFGTLQIVW
jgi:hypothetical protein